MTKHDLPNDILSEDKFLNIRSKLSYYVKEIDSYNCYIFVCELDKLDQLEEYWEFLNEDIAANFQSKLELEIELWNLYVVFIVNDYVPKETKYKIEQDKYSSRKIVFDHLTVKKLTLSFSIIDMIDNKLFSLSSSVSNSQNLKTSKDLIQDSDKFIVEALSDYKLGNKIDQFYTNFLQLKYGK